ncbi:S8 family serine peptidase [Clostridium ganghwense]|uniref:S8 family serine peptidase n=1 Tax=Clostridium ganghwense TaxID=312089 RepID=A0ABT4CSR7_9CLOT|nr:S8 family serine peptidase [Clostridium ganghwense]MCY6372082.1 S8 family serine peptidase [Clostridium ganghwense]
MFSIKNKLDTNLKNAIKNNIYKKYRVIVHCKSLQHKVENRLKGYKCEIICSIPSIGCICCVLSSRIIEKLTEYPEIDYITFDNYALLCGYSVMSANGIAFEGRYKLTGKGICVGLIDSGIYPHTDLKKPNNKIANFIDLINHYHYPYDDNGHGTFMSGIICSSGSSANGMYKGIAEKSNIYMIKAFNSVGRGYVSNILFSIETLIEDSEKYNIKIICLPFELIDYNEFILSLFSKLFDIAIEKNLIIVVPSGHNTNIENSMRGIALLKNCITVGGIDTTSSKKAYFASSSSPNTRIEKPDLCAACVDICSLSSNLSYISERNGQKLYPHTLEKPYTCYTGTSCASAYISGICALLLENNPNLAFKDILSLLKISCNLLNMPKGIQGSGMIDLNRLMP